MLSIWGSTFPKPTLDLDFIGASSLDSRVTFTRGSAATMYDSTGTLVYAPMNLLTYSEQFDNAAWTKVASSVTANAIEAPSGSTTADKLIENATTADHYISQFNAVSGTQYTISVFAKKGERNFVYFSGIGTSNCFFDLNSGTVLGTGTWTSASIQNIGNGWYRCAATATAASTNQFRIGLSSTGTATSYTGDGTSGLYVWGAQINLSPMAGGITSSLSTYYSTTASAYYGPRFDYNPSTLAARGLLIEEQRTNSILQSENFATTWGVIGATISTNTDVSPAGTTTADSIVEDATTSAHRVAQAIAADSTLTYTATVFIKFSGRTWATILLDDNSGNGCRGFYNLSTGVVGTLATSGTGSSGVQSITAVGNGWYRCAITCKPSTVNSSNVRVLVAGTTGDSVSSYAGINGLTSVFVWGAQLEAGAFQTSYIPTVAATVTRSADVASMTGTNFSSWYNAVEGTIFTSGVTPGSSTSTALLSINDNTNNNATQVYYSSSAQFQVRSGGAQQALLISASAASFRAAGVYKTNDFAASFNGGAAVTSSSGSVPTVTQMRLGAISSGSAYLNGWLQRISYYPTRLPNATLQALTA